MSFLSGLGKVLGIAGSAVAAPFTGGASLAGLPAILGTIGKVAGPASQIIGGIAKDRSAGKKTEADLNQNQDQARQKLYETLVNAQLAQGRLGADKAAFELNAPSTRYAQAQKGNFAANAQDVQAQVPSKLQPYMVNFTGGIRPSAFGEQGREAGRKLSDLAMAAMGKDTFQIPELPQAPGLTPLPKAGLLDKFLGVAGPAAAGAGVLGGLFGGGQDDQTVAQQIALGPQLNPADAALGRQNSPPLMNQQPAMFYDPNDPLGLNRVR